MISAALAVLEDEEQRNEFAEFYERYKSRFFNIALKILDNPENAEDAVQEAFLRIADNPEVFLSLGNLKRVHYMYVTIKNVCLDFLNKRKPLTDEAETEDNIAQYDEDIIENSLLALISRDEIIDFIATLPEKQRSVLVLSYSSEMSAKDIAKTLKISVSTVYKQLYTARKAVKKFILERSNDDV